MNNGFKKMAMTVIPLSMLLMSYVSGDLAKADQVKTSNGDSKKESNKDLSNKELLKIASKIESELYNYYQGALTYVKTQYASDLNHAINNDKDLRKALADEDSQDAFNSKFNNYQDKIDSKVDYLSKALDEAEKYINNNQTKKNNQDNSKKIKKLESSIDGNLDKLDKALDQVSKQQKATDAKNENLEMQADEDEIDGNLDKLDKALDQASNQQKATDAKNDDLELQAEEDEIDGKLNKLDNAFDQAAKKEDKVTEQFKESELMDSIDDKLNQLDNGMTKAEKLQAASTKEIEASELADSIDDKLDQLQKGIDKVQQQTNENNKKNKQLENQAEMEQFNSDVESIRDKVSTYYTQQNSDDVNTSSIQSDVNSDRAAKDKVINKIDSEADANNPIVTSNAAGNDQIESDLNNGVLDLNDAPSASALESSLSDKLNRIKATQAQINKELNDTNGDYTNTSEIKSSIDTVIGDVNSAKDDADNSMVLANLDGSDLVTSADSLQGLFSQAAKTVQYVVPTQNSVKSSDAAKPSQASNKAVDADKPATSSSDENKASSHA
ncbi:hypothetical protein LNP16_04505, partial [Apilactobacillus kunkeei]|uniref:hypothetical protein n=1 Tax=Apilactobacillus kunkeei TaxID=148814 RepID=UPI00200B1D59